MHKSFLMANANEYNLSPDFCVRKGMLMQQKHGINEAENVMATRRRVFTSESAECKYDPKNIARVASGGQFRPVFTGLGSRGGGTVPFPGNAVNYVISRPPEMTGRFQMTALNRRNSVRGDKKYCPWNRPI